MAIDQAVLEKAEERGFIDPLTGLPPWDENSLSTLLSIYHQQERIDWTKVPFLLLDCSDARSSVSEVFCRSGCFTSEYTLFWKTQDELQARGGMRPDFLYISRDGSTVAIIENKIGANDSHKGDTYGGQFGRYINYLLHTPVTDPYMILLTSRFFILKTPPWYATELQDAVRIQRSAERVKTRIIVWEDVLDAFA